MRAQLVRAFGSPSPFLLTFIPNLGVQVFIWLYMVALFFEAPRDVRKTRLPYLVVSFFIMALYTIGAVCAAIEDYRVLIEASSIVRQLVEQGWVEFNDDYHRPEARIAGIAGDLSFYVADALLVCGVL
jgi:hypothetical protein